MISAIISGVGTPGTRRTWSRSRLTTARSSSILFAGDPDYVVKLAADGTRAFMAEVPLFPNAIAVDPQGDFFIAGDTTLDGLFTSPGAFQAHHPASTGHFNPYIAEYDPSGQGVIAATYLGSPEGGYSSGSREYVSAIALSPVDPNLLYVVGSTVSPNFPVQSYLNLSRLQPFQSSLNLGAQPDPNFGPDSDAFVAALDTRSMSLVSSTLLGGSGMDAATSVAVDRAGNVYVAGETAPHATLTFTMDGSPDALLLGPSDFPTVDPLMPAYTKGYALNDNGTQSFAAWSGAAAADIFVSKFDSSLESLEFSTYLGGSGHDVVPQIAVDDSGTIHVAGMTAGFGTGVTQQSYAYGPYTGYYYKATGVTDDFPTLHADQPQFGGGFLNVENVLGDGTDLLGYSGFGATYSIDLPVDGFLLAIDQPAALKETLKDSNGGPVGSLAPGEEFSGVVATFTDPRLDVDPSEFTATIDWGDGKVDTGSADGVGVIRDPHGSGVLTSPAATASQSPAPTQFWSPSRTRVLRARLPSPPAPTGGAVRSARKPTATSPRASSIRARRRSRSIRIIPIAYSRWRQIPSPTWSRPSAATAARPGALRSSPPEGPTGCCPRSATSAPPSTRSATCSSPISTRRATTSWSRRAATAARRSTWSARFRTRAARTSISRQSRPVPAPAAAARSGSASTAEAAVRSR
jgi:Beta-propeller repeat